MISLQSLSYMQELRIEIEETRKEMINTGMEYGLTDFRTIALSQELDNLLNRYNPSFS